MDVAGETNTGADAGGSSMPPGQTTEGFKPARVLGLAGRLIRQSWVRWLAILAVFVVVGGLAGLLVSGFAAHTALAVHGSPDTWQGVAGIAAETLLPSLLVIAAVGAVAAAAMMMIFDDAHRGQRPSMAQSLAHGIRRLPAMVMASALVCAGVLGLVVISPILCVLGIVGLLLTALLHIAKPSATLPRWLSPRALMIAAIPFGAAVFWSVRWALVLPNAALETRGAREALTRSADMAKERWWPIARVAAVLAAVAVVPQLLIQLFANNPAGQMVGSIVQLLLLAIPLAALVVVFRAITPESDPELVVDRRNAGGVGAMNAMAVLVVFSMIAAGMIGAAPSALAYQEEPVPTAESVADVPADDAVVPAEGDPVPTAVPVEGDPVDDAVVPAESEPVDDAVVPVEGDPVDDAVVPAEGEPVPTAVPVEGDPVDDAVVPAEGDPVPTAVPVEGEPVPTAVPVEGDLVDDPVVPVEEDPVPTAVPVEEDPVPTAVPVDSNPVEPADEALADEAPVAAAVVLVDAVFTVNDLGDEGDLEIDGICATAAGACTLRAALDEANSLSPDDTATIGFAVSGAIIVETALESDATLTLDGAGQRVAITGGRSAGLLNLNGSFFVANLTFNAADAGYLGGAVKVNAPGAMKNMTFAANSGLALEANASLQLTNATFSGNNGDVRANGAPVEVTFSTFADSSGPSLVTDNGAPFTVAYSVIAGQTPNCVGVIGATDSVSTDTSCSEAQVTSEPLFMATGLANNGGDVDTIAVPSASPAVDGAPASTCAGLFDARGQTRPAGPVEDTNPRCDYGSYEWQDDGRRDFVVNSAGNEPDAVRDGICATAAGFCTLQAVVGEVHGATGASNSYWVTFALDPTVDHRVRWSAFGGTSLTHAAEFHLDASGQKIAITGYMLIDIPVWSLNNVSFVDSSTGCAQLPCPGDVAIETSAASASGSIHNVTFANNWLALKHAHGALELVNVTFWRNSRDISNGATLSVEWSTLAQSEAHAILSTAPMTVANSIISSASTDCLPGAQVTLINSMTRDDSCLDGATFGESLLGGAELADNGGDVPTVALRAGSPAVDVLPCTSPATDARGVARPQGASCDLGAFEWDEAGANTASVAGQIWNDADFDGIEGADETGVTNAVVSLIQVLAGEQTLRGVRSSVDGNYAFVNLGVGDYLVCLDLVGAAPGRFYPTDFAVAIYDLASVPGSACRSVTLTDQAAVTADFAVTTVSSIGGRVWVDIDGDGRAEPGETGADGVVVQLLDSAGDPVASTETVDGRYLFSELKVWEATAPGYIVEFVAPPGSMFTIADASQDDVDSDADQTTGRTPIVRLQGGQDITSVDAGIFVLPGIGDRVFDDLNGNGVFDPAAGERGLTGITVNLYADPATGVVATTTTDDQGNYRFDGLARQGYVVEFVLPEDRLFSPVDQGADDGADSDADPITGRVAVQLKTNEFDNSIDAGLMIGAGVTGVVWDDLDQDGVLEAGEPGLVGVAVQLLTSSDLSVVKVTTTDVDGRYTFVGLPTGRYIVQVTAPFGRIFSPRLSADRADGLSWVYPATGQTGDFGLTPGGELRDINAGTIELVPGSISGVVWRDSDVDGGIDAAEQPQAGWPLSLFVDASGDGVFEFVRATVTGTDGSYRFSQLSPGAYQVQADPDPAFVYTTPNPADVSVMSGVDSTDIGFGVLRTSAVGDRVWNDANGDGVQDQGESGVADVAVRLLDSANQVVARTETDADGTYMFAGLRVWEASSPGYVIEFEAPAGWTFSTAGVGTDDRIDSDADPVSGRTRVVIVALGADDTSIDAGIFEAASVSGQVWDDVDRDGILEPLEAGLADVEVRLIALDDLSIAAAAVTDAQGQYRFDGVAPGRYEVEVTAPLGRVFSPRRQGADSQNDSEVYPETSRTTPFRLFGGIERSDIHAGTYVTSIPTAEPSSISGVVWRDADVDGEIDSGEQLQAGWPVALLSDPDNDGVFELTRTSVTGVDGSYRFSQLEAGRYRVEADTDPVFVYTTPNPAVVSMISGVDLNDVDFGVLRTSVVGDRVWNDANGDGMQDPSESSVAGVEVRLFDSSGDLVASTETDTDGTYMFAGLQVWETASLGYVIEFVAPTGWDFSPADVGTDDRVDSDADPTSGRTPVVIVALGADDTSIDAGIFRPSVATRAASVDGVVWDDVNRDGIFAAGEDGIADIDVLLLRVSDLSVAQATTTAADGSYYFVGMAPGVYSVAVTPPAGRSFSPRRQGGDTAVDSEIIPDSRRTGSLRVGNGAIIADIHVGLVADLPSSITGRVWDDRSIDGVRDTDEPARVDWPVSLFHDANADDQFVLLRSTLSDGDGTYRFGDLEPGAYRVELANDDIYRYSTPLSAELALDGGQSVDDVDFGVWQAPDLEVVVFDDLDRDGQLDPGETTTVQRVAITLSADLDGDDQYEQVGQAVTTLEPTQFAGLEPGSYRVEIAEGTFDITTPNPIDINVAAGPDTRVEIGIAAEACHRIRLYPIGLGQVEIADLVSGQECVGPAGAGFSAGSVVRLRSQGSEAVTPTPYVDAWSFRDAENEYRTAGADDQVSDAFGDEVLVTMGVSDQRVFVYFRRCVSLELDVQGPGTAHVLSAPDCPTALSGDAALIVNPGEPSGLLYRQFATVFVEAQGTMDTARFDRWNETISDSCDRDEEARVSYAPDGCVDEWRSAWDQSDAPTTAVLASTAAGAAESYLDIRLSEDVELAPFFWDLDECQFTIRIQASQPSTLAAVGSASGFSDECPNASLDDWDPATGTSVRTGVSQISLNVEPRNASPIVGWCYSRVSYYDGQEVCVGGSEFYQDLAGFDSANEDERALDWVLRPVYCVEIAASITLVDVNSDDESTVGINLNQPPEQPLVATSEGPNCPIVRNSESDAWLVGTDLSVDALPIPHTLGVIYDGPDVSGAVANVPLDVRYEYQCFTLTNPYSKASNERPHVSVGAQPNCPSAPGEATDRVMSFLGGTVVPLSATVPRGVTFNYWEEGTILNLVHDREHTAIVDADEVLSIDYGEVDTSLWDDIAVATKKAIGAVFAAAPILIPLLGVANPAFGLSMMVLSLGSLGLSVLAKATGDQTLADISSVVSLASPAGMKCYAAWGLSDQRNTVGDDAAFQLRTDYATARLPVAGAQLYARTVVGVPGQVARPVLGVIGGAIDVGFNIDDIETNYGIGSENFAEEAFGQSDDFDTCIAAGNEDSIFLSKD